MCQTCAALDDWQREHVDVKPEPGTLVSVRRLEKAKRQRGPSRPH
ncbi:hypothetical protein [Georgenia sp. TF02-10]|nr:hypothetical protein [Georgenia sp. TF02-10]